MALFSVQNILIAFLFYLISYIFWHRRYFYLIFKIPGPTSIPIIGDICLLLRDNHEIARELGATAVPKQECMRLLGFPIIIILSRLEDFELISKNPFTMDKGPVADGMKEIFNPKSIITLDWPEALHTKKILLRAFVNASQKEVFDSLNKYFANYLNPILETSSTEWLNALHHIREFTTRALLGSSVPINDSDLSIMAEKIKHIVSFFESSVYRGISILHRNDFLYNYVFGGHELKRAWKNAQDEGVRIIIEKKKELSELMKNEKPVPNVYIYNLIREMPNSSNEDLFIELFTVIGAGLETSALNAAFTLIMLGIRPEIQQLVYEEGCRVRTEEGEDDLNEYSLARCGYLSRVIKESLRMYPPAPALSRILREELTFGKYTLPKGAVILTPILTLHRNPKIFENPSTFYPDRFLPENINKIPKSAYMPFGNGPRSCPGYQYGTLSASYTVSTIVHKYKVFTKYTSSEEVDLNLDLKSNLSERKGFPIRLERR